MQLTTCPSSEQLSDYLSGKLSAQEIDKISSHIETCVDCDTAVHKLDDDSDSLMFALRQPLGEELFEQEPELQRAVAAMRFSLPESESQTSCTVLGTVREYDLLEKIGQGGMGTVYKALHSRLKRIVALKVLADHQLGDPAAVDRFSREMQAVGKLAHPNIVRALDAGEAEGRHYLVMEYIDGIDLSRLSRRCGPLPVAEASELVLQVSLALQHAHEHGLVHRDIKPSNVMLTRDGNVKLLDLGIALLQPEEPATSDLTGTGQVMGTLDYMAPEQLDNTHAVDIRADVYGLGATLYKLLCGSAPATDSQSRFRLPGESIPPVPNIRTIRGDIPKPVAAVIQRMLAPNPDQRYDTPADVAEALKPFAAKSNLKQLALAAAADAPSRTMTPPKRFGGRLGRFVITAAALLGMTLAGFAIYVETDKGQIVIHSNVDDVQVLVKRTGKLYDALDELEVDKGDNQWKFRSGNYEVQLLGKTDGLRVKDGVFTLTRDGKAVVTIERDPARAKAVVNGPVYKGKSLDEWIAEISIDKSEELRLNAIPAVEALGADAPSKAIAALIEISSDYEIHMDQSREIPKVIQDLRVRAMQAIQKLSPDAIPKELLNALHDPDVNTRRFAAYFIRHYWKDNPPITIVRNATKDSDEFVRRAACNWLQAYGSDAIPVLLEAFNDESAEVRLAAVKVAWQLSSNKKLTPEDNHLLEAKLFEIVRDENYVVRGFIWHLLPQIATDKKKLLAVSREALRDPRPTVQQGSIGSISRMGPNAEKAIPDLVEILTTHDRSKLEPTRYEEGELNYAVPITAQLIRALGAIGPGAAATVPLIKEFRNHKHSQIRIAVVEAIQQITGEDIELPEDDKTPGNKTAKGPVYGDKTLDEWIALLKTQRSAAARHTAVEPIETLGVDEPEKAIAALIEAGSDYDPRNMEQFEPWFEPRSIWIAINSAIKRLSPSQIPVGVVEALADEDVKKRRFASSLIEQYKDVVPPIEAAKKAAADSDEYVRSQTLEWVDRYDGEAIPILIAAFNDQSEQVRRRAAAVASRLATSGNTSPEDAKLIAPKLYEMLHDKDAQIRADSLTALSRFAFDQDKLLTELIEAVGDSDPKVKSIAIQSLGALGPKAEPAVSVLVASLKQCSRKTLKPKDILTMYSVTHAFRDIAPERLIVALGSIGPSAQSAVPTIKEFLKHDDVYVRNAVVEAIQQITGKVIELPKDMKTAASGPVYDGKTFDEWVTLLKTDKSPQRQIEGIKALVALGTGENASRTLEIVFEMGASHSIERQNDDDRDVVSAALEAIARISNAKLVRPLLLGKLDSEDAGARLFAITVLNYPLASGRDPNYSEKTLARIYAMSGDPAVRVRMKLIEVLGRLASFAKNGESPVPTLIKMYETDKDQQVRYAAFHSLAFLSSDIASAALPLLLDALSSPDATIRKYAVGALEASKPDPKLLNEALIKAIESQEEAVRRSAIEFVDFLMGTGLPKPAELLPTLIAGLKSKDANVQHGTRTIMPLLRGFPQEVVSALVSELDQAQGETKERIFLALVRYNRSGVSVRTEASDILELARLYQTADANRRANIIRVFGEIGPGAKSALPLVEEALKDKDPQVRAAAEAALKAMRSKPRKTDSPPAPKTSGAVYDGKTFEEWVTLLKTDRSAHRQLEGIKALASLRSDENTPLVVSTIIKIAGDGDRISTGKNDPNVAESAEAILRQIGQEAAVPQLLTALESDDVTMRRFAVNALDRFEITEEVAPAILKLPEDDDIQVRLASTRLLRQAGEPGVAALAKMVEEDKSDGVRARAANSLGVLKENARSAVPALLSALFSDDGQVLMATQFALGQIKPDQKLLNDALLKLVAADVAIEFRGFHLGPFGLVDENSTATLPALIAGMADDDQMVRSAASQVFRKLKAAPDDVLPALIAAVQDEKFKYKIDLAEALARYGAEAQAAMPALIKLYETSDDDERRSLLYAFEKIDLQHKDVQPLLREAAKSDDKNLSRAAQKLLRVVAEGTDVATVSLTIKVTADGKLSIGDKTYDLQALKTLLDEQVKQAGERGVAVRIDAAVEVRFEAVNTLIEMCKKAGVRNVSLGTTKVAPAAKNDGAAVYDGKTFDEWLSILKTETNPAKLAPVITAVGATGARGREREATAAILNVAKLMIAPFNESLYSNEDEKKLGELYNAINIALTRIGAPHATGALIEAVNDPHLGMRRHAQQVLYEWTMSEEYADQIFAALKHNDPKLREWAVAQLAKIADSGVRKFDEIVAQLFEIISNDKSIAMRRAAAEELRRLTGNTNTGDRRAQNDGSKARRMKEVDGALEQLYSLAKDQDPTVRFCVLWVLTRIEADPATLIPLLADAAGDEKSATQQLVIDELSNLAPRSPAAIAALITSYPRFGADERIRVVNAFGHKGAIAAPAIPLLKEAAKSDDQLLREAAREALKKVEPAKQ